MSKPSDPTRQPLVSGGPSNQPSLPGESHSAQSAPPPAYTASPIYQGMPFQSSATPDQAGPFVPLSREEASTRATHRFFKALVVSFLIWVVIGAIFGGGIEDMKDDHRRDRPYPPPRIPRDHHRVAASDVLPDLSVEGVLQLD